MPSTESTGSARVVALELLVRCRACDGVVPINRLAQAAACHQCGRRIELTADTWGLVLREAADSVTAREGEERAAIVEAGAASFRCVFRRAQAHCLACREPLPVDEAAALAGRAAVFCVGCGARVPLRRAPFAAPGLELVVGEEPEPERGGASETRTLPCGGCGAPLELDGLRRTVTCGHCKTSSAIPEELWRDLHPRREVRRWFLVFAPGVEASAPLASWASVASAALDEAQNVYCVGRLHPDDPETAVWCVAPDMTLRWAKRSLTGLPPDRARVFLAGSGRIAVWFPGSPVVAFLDATTGDTLSTYPPPDTRSPFPMTNCVELARDVDGTFIALLHGARGYGREEHCTFVRFTEGAQIVDLWPETPSPAPPELGEEIPSFRNLPSKPRWIMGVPRLTFGWDGTLFVYGGVFAVGSSARIARDGFVTVDRMGLDSGSCVTSDGRGSIHLLGGTGLAVLDRRASLLWKLDLDGGPEGIAAERHLAVGPNGEIVLVGDGGRLRRMGAGGAVLFSSEASRHADQGGKGGWSRP